MNVLFALQKSANCLVKSWMMKSCVTIIT